MMDPAAKVSWNPDTGLPFAVGASSSLSASKAKVSSIQGSGSKLPISAGIWQTEKSLEQTYGSLVPPIDSRKRRKLEKKSQKETAGSKWFDMPASTVTPETRRELQLLRLRGVLDPKRHYKANDSNKIPKFFQIGTVIENSADYYSGRLTKKERKQTFADELLADSSLKKFSKRKFAEIQESKQAGGRKSWNKKKNKQKPSWVRT